VGTSISFGFPLVYYKPFFIFFKPEPWAIMCLSLPERIFHTIAQVPFHCFVRKGCPCSMKHLLSNFYFILYFIFLDWAMILISSNVSETGVSE